MLSLTVRQKRQVQHIPQNQSVSVPEQHEKIPTGFIRYMVKKGKTSTYRRIKTRQQVSLHYSKSCLKQRTIRLKRNLQKKYQHLFQSIVVVNLRLNQRLLQLQKQLLRLKQKRHSRQKSLQRRLQQRMQRHLLQRISSQKISSLTYHSRKRVKVKKNYQHASRRRLTHII